MTTASMYRSLSIVLLATLTIPVGCSKSTDPPSNFTWPTTVTTAGPSPKIVPSTPVPPGPKHTSKAEATWDYWRRLSEIAKKLKVLESAAANAKTAIQWRASYSQAETVLTRIATAISNLPISNVDREATAYATKVYAHMLDLKAWISDANSLTLSAQQLRHHANSGEAFVEAFFRGFFGDPLGKHNEIRQQAFQLDATRQKLIRRWQVLVAKGNKIDAEELSIRSSLTRKYKREFSTLG